MNNCSIIGTMTMNAGDGIYNSPFKWIVENVWKNFQQVIVFDGKLTEKSKAYYANFPNVQAVDMPWDSKYHTRYEKFIEMLEDGQYGFWADDDEMPSPELARVLNSPLEFKEDIVKIPCVLHLTEDGKKYYPAEKDPDKNYHGQWTKSILFRKSENIYVRHFGSHVIVDSTKKDNYSYCPLPYYHMKSLESFVYNDVWQAFLCPEGQGYSLYESKIFKSLTSCYKTSLEFETATKDGEWSLALQNFAWKYRNDNSRPISRLAWVYFILCKAPMPSSDQNMTFEKVKSHVLSKEHFSIYEQNKKNNIGLNL